MWRGPHGCWIAGISRLRRAGLVGAIALSATVPHPSIPAVTVAFDNPGKVPRPLKETVRPIDAPARTLTVRVEKVSYPGFNCGFTFRGARPPSPVTVRARGKVGSVSFDSGALNVSWTPDGARDSSAGTSTDQKARWSFVAVANSNRNGPGWVVSMGGVPSGAKTKPSALECAITAGNPTGFTKAHGPVGYWAGFATV